MISRRTTLILAQLMDKKFSGKSVMWEDTKLGIVDTTKLHKFLYFYNFPAWFCNACRNIPQLIVPPASSDLYGFIAKLHTGESFIEVAPEWTETEREQNGQALLLLLVQAMLSWFCAEREKSLTANRSTSLTRLQRSVELDGYVLSNSRLLQSESEVVNTSHEANTLVSLYTSLALANREVALHHLHRSEEHYVADKYDDAISNARKFYEVVEKEVARDHSRRIGGSPIKEATLKNSRDIREYLKRHNLIDEKEQRVLINVSDLLSDKGGHAYVAEKEEARLLRIMALTLAQFILNRYSNMVNTDKRPDTAL